MPGKIRKRRLRKKRRVGEFQEFGFDVHFKIHADVADPGHEQVLDDFILEAIEAHGLAAGGGGREVMDFFVTSARRRGSATNNDRQAVEAWLRNRGELIAHHVGELRDAWYD